MIDNNINLNVLNYITTEFNNITDEDIYKSNNIYDFIEYNSDYIYKSIEYIYYLIDMNKRLSNINNGKIINNKLYNSELIELILDYQKRDNIVLNNILYTQRVLLNKLLKRLEYMFNLLLNKKVNIEDSLYEFSNILRYEYKLRRKNVKVKILVR